MFGLRFWNLKKEEKVIRTTRREMALLTGTITDQRQEIFNLREALERERKRADAAVNLLLYKTQRAVLTPATDKKSEETAIQQSLEALDMFDEGDEDKPSKRDIVEELQNL